MLQLMLLYLPSKGLRDLSPLFEGEREVSEGPHVVSDVPESEDPHQQQ